MTESLMPLPAMAQTSSSVPPAVLLANHLKALKLPTFVRDYEKVAFEAAQDRADYPRYLLLQCELERIDRERRMVERRIRMQSSRTPRALTHSILPPILGMKGDSFRLANSRKRQNDTEQWDPSDMT